MCWVPSAKCAVCVVDFFLVCFWYIISSTFYYNQASINLALALSARNQSKPLELALHWMRCFHHHHHHRSIKRFLIRCEPKLLRTNQQQWLYLFELPLFTYTIYNHVSPLLSVNINRATLHTYRDIRFFVLIDIIFILLSCAFDFSCFANWNRNILSSHTLRSNDNIEICSRKRRTFWRILLGEYIYIHIQSVGVFYFISFLCIFTQSETDTKKNGQRKTTEHRRTHKQTERA